MIDFLSHAATDAAAWSRRLSPRPSAGRAPLLGASLKAEKITLKLIKSGQRNVKNFSESYKRV